MDESKSPQMSRAETEETKVRDEYTAAVPYEDMGDLSATVQQKSHLTSDLPGQLCQAAGRFGGHDLLSAGFTPAETLYPLELNGLKAGGLSFDFCYSFSSGKQDSIISIQESDENRSACKSVKFETQRTRRTQRKSNSRGNNQFL
jgi:hypothetical protein